MLKKSIPLLRIGQIAEMNDIPVSTLNFYIGRGLLKHKKKSKADHRLFDPDEIREKLERIKSLQNAGKSIDDIKKIINRRRRRT